MTRGRSPRVALAATAIATLALAAGYGATLLPGATPAWAPWCFALGIPTLLTGLMLLGVARAGRPLGWLALPLALVWLLLAAGFGAALLLPPVDPARPALWLGLPPAAAVVLYGIGLLPTLILPLAYALTFDRVTLSDDDLARVRAARDAAGRG